MSNIASDGSQFELYIGDILSKVANRFSPRSLLKSVTRCLVYCRKLPLQRLFSTRDMLAGRLCNKNSTNYINIVLIG
jgi:hypothetical protein